MARNKRYPKADREHVLWRIANLVQAGNWITLDTETTGRGLEDQVIEVAICEPINARVFLVFGGREKNLIHLLYYLSSKVMRGGKECQQRYCFHYQMNSNSLQ